jgi:hypothetical protein
LRENIQFQIDDLNYSNITNSNYNRKTQLLFLDFYDKVKNDLTLKEFRILFKNSKINKEKIVSIIKNPFTKTDLLYRYFVSISMFIVSICLFILILFSSQQSFYFKLFLYVISVIILLIGLFHISENIRLKRLLKKIEIYNDFII